MIPACLRGLCFPKADPAYGLMNGSKDPPRGPAPPNPETASIPSGTLEPTTASWEAEPIEAEPPVGRHELVPFR
jgi:hypothetical protein